ncbi:uncharacterized protein LOC135371708 [Ornithodoros turicata]|uniref:uncharacterized protein LOC135371708 n=1 Tax=Ornithodoros turicata TaxID=34597 RepID=UPI003138B1A1
MEDLERLKKLRTACRGTVTRTTSDLTALLATTPLPHDQLTSKLTFLESKAATLAQLDGRLQGIIEENLLEDECTACDRYLESITAITVQVRRALSTTAGPVSNNHRDGHQASPQHGHGASDGVSLPKLHIDTFNGELSKWQGFWDQFRTSIHDNSRLSQVNKLKYLVSLVSGSAATAIEGLTITDQNYVTAVDILKARFGKDKLLINDHLDSLFDLKPVTDFQDVRGLRDLHGTVTARVRNLQALGIPTSQYDVAVRRAIVRKIPHELELEYYRMHGRDATLAPESLSDLMDFLNKEMECRERLRRDAALDNVGSRPKTGGGSGVKRKSSLSFSASSLAATVTQQSCVLCKSKDHALESCTAILTPEEKRIILRREGRCFLCGKRSHLSKDCRVCWRLRCGKCNRRHLTQLCPGPSVPAQNHTSVTTVVEDVVTSFSSSEVSKTPKCSEVLLQTAKVWLVGPRGRKQLIRVLFDGGSQRSFIRADISKRMECKDVRSEDLRIHTLGNVTSARTQHRCVQLVLRSQDASHTLVMDAIEYDQICTDSLPSLPFDMSKQLKDMGLQLADEPFSAPVEISLLIGSDYYWQVVTGQTVRLSKHLVAAETLFGWTIQGVCSSDGMKGRHDIQVMKIGVETDVEVDTDRIYSQLQAFWDLEHLGITDQCSTSSSYTDPILQEFSTSACLQNGRYMVRLPWNLEKRHMLGDNKVLAFRRLSYTTKRLLPDPSLMEEYDSTIRQYLLNGHAERFALDPRISLGVETFCTEPRCGDSIFYANPPMETLPWSRQSCRPFHEGCVMPTPSGHYVLVEWPELAVQS